MLNPVKPNCIFTFYIKLQLSSIKADSFIELKQVLTCFLVVSIVFYYTLNCFQLLLCYSTSGTLPSNVCSTWAATFIYKTLDNTGHSELGRIDRCSFLWWSSWEKGHISVYFFMCQSPQINENVIIKIYWLGFQIYMYNFNLSLSYIICLTLSSRWLFL